jgi:hypothetical protein
MLARGRVRSGILPLPGFNKLSAPFWGAPQWSASDHGWHGCPRRISVLVSHRRITSRNAAGHL